MPPVEPRFLAAPDDDAVRAPLRGLVSVLREAGYSASAAGSLIQADGIYGLDVFEFPFYRRRAAADGPVAAAASLFLLEEASTRARADGLLGAGLVADLLEIGLFVLQEDGRLRSAVNLYPLDDLVLASDPMFFWKGLPGERPRGFEVYYVGRDSFDLAQATPRQTTGRALDLCTGTGVQALVAARHAEEVLGIDINPRAVRFARMNAQMNAIENARFQEGDLFAPIAAQTFDRITANPPFVAAPPGESTLFRDGGQFGEDVLARVLSGLSRHLAPSGELYLVTHFVRRPGDDEVLAGPLGRGGFDVLVLDLAQYDARTMIFGQARPKLLGGGFDEYAGEVARWLDHADAARIEKLSYSIVAIRRAPEFRLTRQALPPRALFPGASPAQAVEKWRAG